MAKELIVNSTSLETKLAILEDDQVTEIFIEREKNRSILGNIYKGRVMRVLPGMQAAFVDIGLDRNAFLYVSDFFEDYEDFEEIFRATDAAADKYLADQQEPDSRGKATRSKGARQPSKRPRSDKEKTPRGRSQPSPERPSESAPPALVTAEPRILPEWLPIDPSLKDLLKSTETEEIPSILPELLTVVAHKPRRRGGRSTKSSRRVQKTDSDIHHFAVGRTQRRDRSRKKTPQGNGPLIGDLLKEGQEVLVQVAKEPIGKKGARITSHIVLPGRYLVFMPTVDHVGVSRRIESAKERQRLRDLVLELRGDVTRGFIVRTAGEAKTKDDFRQDMMYLTRLWEQVRSKADRNSAPCMIHSELDVVQRIIRDFLSDDYRAVRVDDEDEYERIVEFISNFNPSLVKKVRLYNKHNPIFDEFDINPEIERSLKSKVWLKNGGYIVINQTEALVAIDVNTGKYVGRTNSLEDTIARTNLDAVREVARQIRLRDLGGIIVVDFIDMNDPKNQHKVYEALQNELRKDKAPSKILPFNEFGLIAITRKRAKQSLERTLCQPCATCEGTGLTKSVRTVCYTIHGEIRKALPSLGEGRELIVRCHPDVGTALLDLEKVVAKEIEEMTGKELTIRKDPLMHFEQFDLVEA